MENNIRDFLEGKPITVDDLFAVLSHERRRYSLYCLEKYRTPMALADLAEEVARLEYGVRSLAEVPAEDVKRIYCDLYHSHVPKMEEANLVTYSQAKDAVDTRYSLSNLDL